jgi:hypothetical protein
LAELALEISDDEQSKINASTQNRTRVSSLEAITVLHSMHLLILLKSCGRKLFGFFPPRKEFFLVEIIFVVRKVHERISFVDFFLSCVLRRSDVWLFCHPALVRQ